jgi:hypothetical protein
MIVPMENHFGSEAEWDFDYEWVYRNKNAVPKSKLKQQPIFYGI